MPHTQDMKFCLANRIDDQKRRFRYDPLSRACNAAGAAQFGVMRQQSYRSFDRISDPFRGSSVIPCDERELPLEVADRSTKPLYAHGEYIS